MNPTIFDLHTPDLCPNALINNPINSPYIKIDHYLHSLSLHKAPIVVFPAFAIPAISVIVEVYPIWLFV